MPTDVSSQRCVIACYITGQKAEEAIILFLGILEHILKKGNWFYLNFLPNSKPGQ